MRSTIPVLSAATAALALVTVASCTTTAGAEPTPEPPPVVVAAEPGPACGTVRMDYLTSTAPFEVYRAVTKEPVAGEDVLDWIRQPRDPISRIDTIIPSGYSVTYRVLIAGGESYYSEPVVTEECPEPPDPTPAPSTPSTSPTPSPSPSSSADPSPSASAGPAAPSSPAPATKDSEGGLAATGVDR